MRQKSVEIVTQALMAVEQRLVERLKALYHPQVEFNWPPGLPYSGTFVGQEVAEMQRRFHTVWHPLQPTDRERRLDFSIVAAGDDGAVVARYRWKAVDALGRRFETLTLGEYQVRDGLFARARMYYYDLPGLIAFLEQASTAHAGPAA